MIKYEVKRSFLIISLAIVCFSISGLFWLNGVGSIGYKILFLYFMCAFGILIYLPLIISNPIILIEKSDIRETCNNDINQRYGVDRVKGVPSSKFAMFLKYSIFLLRIDDEIQISKVAFEEVQ